MNIQKFKKNNKGYRGYIFSRDINFNFIPHRVQNLVIKDFAERNNLFFKLSSTEYIMKNSFHMLKALLHDTSSIDGVIFYSYEMFFENIKLCIDSLNNLIKKKKNIFFALEEIEVKNNKDLLKLKKIIQLKNKTTPHSALKDLKIK